MIKSGQELAKLYIEDAKEDIKAIRKALRKKEKLSKKAVKDQRIDHQTYERPEETVERIG